MQVTYLGHAVEGDRPLGGKGGADPGGHRLRPGLVVVLRGKPGGGGIKRGGGMESKLVRRVAANYLLLTTVPRHFKIWLAASFLRLENFKIHSQRQITENRPIKQYTHFFLLLY